LYFDFSFNNSIFYDESLFYFIYGTNLEFHNNKASDEFKLLISANNVNVSNYSSYGMCLDIEGDNHTLNNIACDGQYGATKSGGAHGAIIADVSNSTIKNLDFFSYNFTTGNVEGIIAFSNIIQDTTITNITVRDSITNGLDCQAITLTMSASSPTLVLDKLQVRNISSTVSARGHAIATIAGTNVNITNSNFTDIDGYSAKYSFANGKRWNFINSIFNKSAIYYEGSTVTTSVYFTTGLNITDASYTGIEDANIEIYNNNSILISEGITNSDGLVYFDILEYNQTDDATYVEGCQGGNDADLICQTPHNLSANKVGWSTNSTIINASLTQTINLILNIISSDSCSCPGDANNWEIDLEDNCDIQDVCDIGTGNITFINTGSVTFNNTITMNRFTIKDQGDSEKYYLGGECKIYTEWI